MKRTTITNDIPDRASRTSPATRGARVRKNTGDRVETALRAQNAAEPADAMDVLEMMALGLDVPTEKEQDDMEIGDLTKEEIEEFEKASFAALEALETMEPGRETEQENRHERKTQGVAAEKKQAPTAGKGHVSRAESARAAMDFAGRDGANQGASPDSPKRRKVKSASRRTDGRTATRKRGKGKSSGSNKAA